MDISGWRRAVQLSVNPAQVSGTTHLDFTIKIVRANLPDEMCDPTSPYAAQPDGGDIRATGDNSSYLQIPIHIVAFEHDSAPGKGDAKVEIRVKRFLFGNAGVWLLYNATATQSKLPDTDLYGRNAVWSEYIGAYLMESATTVADATGGGNDLTITDPAATAITGPNGEPAVRLNALACGTTPVLATDQDYTLSVVARRNGALTAFNPFVETRGGGANSAGVKMQAGSSSTVYDCTVVDNSNGFHGLTGNRSWPDATWIRVGCATGNGTTSQQAYMNGANITIAGTAIRGTGNRSLAIGDAGANSIDFAHVLIRKGLSADARMATEDNNYLSPATFLTTGTPYALAAPVSVNIGAGVLALTGADLQSVAGQSLTFSPGVLALRGQPLSVSAGVVQVIGPATLSLDGQAFSITAGASLSIDASSGSLSLSGAPLSQVAGAGMAIAAGSLTITGQALQFSNGEALRIDSARLVVIHGADRVAVVSGTGRVVVVSNADRIMRVH